MAYRLPSADELNAFGFTAGMPHVEDGDDFCPYCCDNAAGPASLNYACEACSDESGLLAVLAVA